MDAIDQIRGSSRVAGVDTEERRQDSPQKRRAPLSTARDEPVIDDEGDPHVVDDLA